MTYILPSELLELWHKDVRPVGPVAVDTETSGLFADDGARISTVSVAWEDTAAQSWLELYEQVRINENKDLFEWAVEEYAPDESSPVISIAWPFDQGVEGKPEDDGQFKLWPDAKNLPYEEWTALLDWLQLAGDEYGLVFHHAKFDMEKFRVGLRDKPNSGRDFQNQLAWDTQNVNDLIYPTFATGLKPTASRLWGAEQTNESDLVKNYLRKAKLPAGRWDLIPWDILGPYASKDARMTTCLYLRQTHDIDAGKVCTWLLSNEQYGEWDASPIYDKIERRLQTSKVLYRMEARGLPYDEAGSREAAMMCAERAAEIEPKLPFEPTEKAAKAFFFTDAVTKRGVEGLNQVPYSVTDKGNPQLTAEILQRMVADEIPYADMWSQWNKVTTAASMWYNGYADKMGTDGRLRCAFRQNGTVSTRFSVERVNLQAIPQNYRLSDHKILAGIPTPRDYIAKAVEAMDGWKLYELDLAQAELRVGAMFAECSKMLEMISNDEDLHTYTTKALFPHIDPEDPQFNSKWRQVGKRGNFSLQFGSGANTFKKMVSKETGIMLDDYEASRIVRDWNALYPEYNAAIRSHMAKVDKRQSKHGNGWVTTVNGERRWFKMYEESHKAFNQRVQANLAQFAIDWMIKTDSYLTGFGLDRSPIGGAGLILTVHDSQVLLLPDTEEGEQMAADCVNFGKLLWKEMFPGVPGDVDYH